MEKQKIFWIVLSVSIFVVVVLVVGVLLLKQKPAGVAATETVSPIGGTGTQLYEYSAQKPQTPALETKPNEPEVMKFVIGDEGAAGSETGKTPQIKGTEEQNAQLPAPKAPVEKPTLRAPAAERPAVVAQKPAPARSRPVRPAPSRTVRVAEYWIQTGSYRSQTRAEDLAKLLSDKGLAGRVFSYSTKDETMFRVRVGPYTNKDEAAKFLAIVKQVQGLEASYISLVSGSRVSSPRRVN